MKTKLVYVLTCKPEATFIEQALMSVYTARYHNPDAHVVLLVDDLTDKLLVGKRAEILDYISEKIVIPFEDKTLSAVYRSRWIKTNVRKLISGDFLFIDSDTIITHSLAEMDDCPYEVGAVLDGHLPLAECHPDMHTNLNKRAALIGFDASQIIHYFSSGVMYVQDTEKAHKLYALWHKYWLDGHDKLLADQPSLLKADDAMGYIIHRIDEKWNCVAYTQVLELRHAKILHFSRAYLASYLFSTKFCTLLRKNGLRGNSFYEWAVLHPHCTYIPFDNYFYYYKIKDIPKVIRQLTQMACDYATYIDSTFEDLKEVSGIYPPVIQLLSKGYYNMAVWILCFFKWRKTHWKKFEPKNFCAK